MEKLGHKVMVDRVWDWPVGAEESEMSVFVGYCDAHEESPMGETRELVVGMVGPAVTDDVYLAPDGWGSGCRVEG